MTLIETLYHNYEGTDVFRMSLYIQRNFQNQPQLPVESHLGAFYGVKNSILKLRTKCSWFLTYIYQTPSGHYTSCTGGLPHPVLNFLYSNNVLHSFYSTYC